MLKRRSLLIALAAGSSGVACRRTPSSTDVYEALFRRFGDAGKTYLVLEAPLDATGAMSDSKELLHDFPVSRSRHGAEDFGSVSVRLLSLAEYHDIFSEARNCEGSWAELRRRFQDTPALLQLSAVCFKKGGTEAFVLLEAASACFGGSLEKLRFAHDGAAWKFIDSENLWRA